MICFIRWCVIKGDPFLYWIQFLNYCISYDKIVPHSCPSRLCMDQQPQETCPLLETVEERRVLGTATQTVSSISVQRGLNQECIQVPEQPSDADFGICVHLPFPFKQVKDFYWPCCRLYDATPAWDLQTKYMNSCIT